MKTLLRIFAVILCASSLQLASCKKHHAESITDTQLAKLRANWKITHVTRDTAPQDGYANLILSLTGNGGSKSFDYKATGRPFVSPWKDNGVFTFDTTNPIEVLHRDDDLEVKYVVTATTLTLRFTFNGAGYVSARTTGITGQWVFECQKQ